MTMNEVGEVKRGAAATLKEENGEEARNGKGLGEEHQRMTSPQTSKAVEEQGMVEAEVAEVTEVVEGDLGGWKESVGIVK
ncbi:unnamed protein product, partial [Closterium sp. NIES-54]